MKHTDIHRKGLAPLENLGRERVRRWEFLADDNTEGLCGKSALFPLRKNWSKMSVFKKSYLSSYFMTMLSFLYLFRQISQHGWPTSILKGIQTPLATSLQTSSPICFQRSRRLWAEGSWGKGGKGWETLSLAQGGSRVRREGGPGAPLCFFLLKVQHSPVPGSRPPRGQ